VAAKRAPLRVAADGGLGAASGGSPSIVGEQAAALGAPLLSSAHDAGETALAARHPDGVDVRLTSGRTARVELLRHADGVLARVQRPLSSDWLWAWLHSLWEDEAQAPGPAAPAAWRAQRAFTEDYGRALTRRLAGRRRSVLLLHDYQLACVPAWLREHGQRVPSAVALHTAWPDVPAFRLLPRFMRRDVLAGLLAADAVVFLARRWAQRFRACVASELGDEEAERARVVVAPLGPDPDALEPASPSPLLRKWVGERPLVVHCGRTDPIKDAPGAVDAFALAARRDGRVAGARMLVRAVPHHLDVAANRRYAARLSAAVERANAEGAEPAVRVAESEDRAQALAELARADVVVANSVVDGENLVALEAALVNRRAAPLVLSEGCGAAELLGSASLVVRPGDVEGTAAAIAEALAMPPARRRELAERRRALAAEWTPQRWTRTIVDAVAPA
jgi:trehalose 6-phosphate synthase